MAAFEPNLKSRTRSFKTIATGASWNPSTLCSHCSHLFTNSQAWNPTIEGRQYSFAKSNLRKWVELETGIASGCAVCREFKLQFELWNGSFNHRVADEEPLKIVVVTRPGNPPVITGKLASSGGFRFRLVPFEVVAPQMLDSSHIGKSTSSEETRLLATAWFQECLAEHNECRVRQSGTHFVPSRLIRMDIRPTSDPELLGGNVSLILREDLLEQNVDYVALSHRWSEGPSLTLTANNFSRLRNGIKLTELPVKYRNAIEICRWIGCMFIWIDSLCIFQDDPDDWASEAPKMDAVYSNAILTVAAGTFDSSNSSIFVARNSMAIVPMIEVSVPEVLEGRYCMVLARQGAYDIDLNQLNKRGWVVQERCLSPRVILFTDRTIFWECCAVQASESWPAGHMNRYLVSKVNGPGPIDDVWRDIAQNYSGAQLTYKSDRFMALAGIASAVQQKTKREYIAGLWKETLIEDLSWIMCTGRVDNLKRTSTLRSYGAPTWTWLSVPGTCEVVSKEGLESRRLAEVVKVQINLARSESPTGDILSAQLRLRGQLKPAVYRRIGRSPDFWLFDALWDGRKIDILKQGPRRRSISTFTDVEFDENVQEIHVFLLPLIDVGKAPWTKLIPGIDNGIMALALVPKPNVENTYERVGIVQIHPQCSHRLFQRRESGLDAGGKDPLLKDRHQIQDPCIPEPGEDDDSMWEDLPFQEIELV